MKSLLRLKWGNEKAYMSKLRVMKNLLRLIMDDEKAYLGKLLVLKMPT